MDFTVWLGLAAGLFLLFYGGDVMVSGAVQLARRLGVSPLLIGLTLVGFGTSTPELLTSLLAALDGSPGIAIGNVVGSNIANILLVLGAAAAIYPVAVDVKSFRKNAVFLVVSALLLTFGVWFGQFGPFFGACLVGLLIFYVWYMYRTDDGNSALSESDEKSSSRGSVFLTFKTLLGIALTVLGAKLLVDNAVLIARAFQISEAVIGLTLVAVGTSLPELAVSVMAAFRRQNDVAFGNVVGSNIYNALFVLGFPALFVTIPAEKSMLTDSLIMSGVTGVLIALAFAFGRISRWLGVLFLAGYAAYVFFVF